MKSEPKITIGMAVYNDADGVRSTIINLRRIGAPLHLIELVFVNTNPSSKDGGRLKNWVMNWVGRDFANVIYTEMASPRGTSPPRDRIFRIATAPLVMVIDPHIEIHRGGIEALLSVSEKNPQSRDLWQGPLYYDNDTLMATHMKPVWRDQMYGIWDSYNDRMTEESFEIPGHGLGLFACHKEAWVGFHEALRGFGGEELHLQEKVRALGGKCILLTKLGWTHRFRDGHTPYPNMLHEKIRNNVIWRLDIAAAKKEEPEFSDIYNHFVSLNEDQHGYQIENLSKHLLEEHGFSPEKLEGKSPPELQALHAQHKIPEEEWNRLMENPYTLEDYRNASKTNFVQIRSEQPPPKSSLEEIYSFIKAVPRDLEQHMDKLRELSSQCDHVTEFTKRRESTVALLLGQPKILRTYTQENDILLKQLQETLSFEGTTNQGLIDAGIVAPKLCEKWMLSTGKVASIEYPPIEPTDMLFIDTMMDGTYLYQELKRHGGNVRKWIIVAGTESFGIQAEGSKNPGLLVGWYNWASENPEWKRVYHNKKEYGLTVFSRMGEPTIDFGPGTELKIILHSLGINPSPTCDCNAKASRMDDWGVQGCREHFDVIVGWMRDNQERWGWTSAIQAAALAVSTGIAAKINWLDPYPGLVTLAIERAEVKA